MTEEELVDALSDKMRTEQEKFREELLQKKRTAHTHTGCAMTSSLRWRDGICRMRRCQRWQSWKTR